MIAIPLADIKGVDKIYDRIRGLPIEFIAVITFISWMVVHSNIRFIVIHLNNGLGLFRIFMLFSHQNVRTVYFLGVLFLALSCTGYFVYYIKDIYITGWKVLRKESLLVKLYMEFLAVDLKKRQSLRIFILILIQPFIGFIFVLIANDMSDPLGVFIFLVTIYLVSAFLYIRYKVAKVRKNYLQLFEITQEIADGNLQVDVSDHLGYFDALKDELITIQNGLGHAVERVLTSERMKGDLITNVSHDLKTPLTSIITYVDLLQVEGLSEEKRQQYLKTLELKQSA